MAFHEWKTYQHPVLDLGGNRTRGRETLVRAGSGRLILKLVASSFGAIMGNQRGRFLEELPLRVDLTKLTTGMVGVGLCVFRDDEQWQTCSGKSSLLPDSKLLQILTKCF